ncbi:MAG: hypothetical protein KDE27_17860 [Planctomycetes bacterium]|nr:hypothetical protein [Planctomycetota bacterium]
MQPSILIHRGLTVLLALLTGGLTAQEWTGEQLATEAQGFQAEKLTPRLEQIGNLLDHKNECYSPLVARIHGDHREYLLKVDRLIGELVDERWDVREQAERTLIEIGGRAKALIQQHRDDYEFVEQHLRCARILDALTAKGTEQEDREELLLRGLVQTALYLDAEPRLLRALRSALGHTDPTIVEATIRALGKLGGDDEVGPVEQMLTWKGGMHRRVTLAALARLRSDRALAVCRDLLNSGDLTDAETFVMLRALHARDDTGASKLLGELAASPNRLLAAGAKAHTSKQPVRTPARFTLADTTPVDGQFGGFFGDSMLVHGAFPGLEDAELAFDNADVIDFPGHEVAAADGNRVFLNQGSLVIGDIVSIDPEALRLRSAMFGDLTLPRSEIQGIALDPELDRLVGASIEHDRIRLRDDSFLEGHIRAGGGDKVAIELLDGSKRDLPFAEIAGILFTRPRATEPDNTTYTRLDLTTGERLIAFVSEASGNEIAITAPLLGSAVVPLTQVHHIELGVGGGALWGFTLIADYSDNRVIEVDDQGRIVFALEDVFGAWDAECLDNGNLLITEFSVSRVQEINRKGEQIWVYENLKNPYDADRLPNGNTLIADTFGSRVVEVNPGGEEVWVYDQNIRPFDCDRLPNGNTLIADVLKDRVIEVNVDGEIVWEIKNLPNVHDADRLPNGNTLVTLRNKGEVLELDRDGNTVWQLTGLSSPSDADRLPNGHTLVAENTRVREFDRRKNEVWKKETSWAVEVNRY